MCPTHMTHTIIVNLLVSLSAGIATYLALYVIASSQERRFAVAAR